MQSTITLIIALIGAGLGIFNALESYRDKRERFRVVPKWVRAQGWTGMSIEVTNTGSIPITIEDVGLLVGESKSNRPERVAILNDKIVNGLSWTPAKTPRFEVSPVIQSGDWTESFDAPTQPVFAGGAPGAAEQGR